MRAACFVIEVRVMCDVTARRCCQGEHAAVDRFAKEAPFRIQPLQLMNDPMFPDRLVNDI